VQNPVQFLLEIGPARRARAMGLAGRTTVEEIVAEATVHEARRVGSSFQCAFATAPP
jgi:hypothetical protein